MCEAYWYPLYGFLRSRGCDADEAADLIQGYFTCFLEKDYIGDVHRRAGRFRSFLLASLKHFVSNKRIGARTLKRGGGDSPISLDTHAAERLYVLEPVDRLTPELIYERRWALTVVERAQTRLREQAEASGRLRQFEVLGPLLMGEGETRRYCEIARDMNMSVGSVKTAIHRLRRSFGQQLRREISDTVADPEEVDDEVRHLLTVLRDSRGAGL